MPANLSAYIGAAVTVIWFVGILVWLFSRKYGKTKIVNATVVNKQIVEGFSKYAGSTKAKRYYVTFLINGKRKSFSVSQVSYKGYRKGESGTLKYRADRLLDFH